MKQYWSLTEGVFNCLIDRRRTLAFARAITKTIRQNDIVVDLGTGSGIMALFAAKAGARKVYAIEHEKKNAHWLRGVFSINGFDSVIETIIADARNVVLPEKVDVIICEMVATGLIEELQIPVMNNALKFANKNPRVILNAIENYVDVVNVYNRFYGFHIPAPQYEYPDEPRIIVKSITPKHLYKTVRFTEFNKLSINITVKLPVTINGGIINGIRISNRTIFCDGSSFNHSFAYCYPIILPTTPIKVSRGNSALVNLSYRMCKGLGSVVYNVAAE